MTHNLDATKLLDRMCSDLRIAIQVLISSGNDDMKLDAVFSHIRVKILGQFQRIWEINCLRQLSDLGYITFNEGRDEIISFIGNLKKLVFDSDKIKEIVIKACDAVPNNPTWDNIAWNEIKSQVVQPSAIEVFSLEPSENILDTNQNLDDPSWENVYELFSKEKSEVLLYIRKMMGKFATGEKWARVDFFPSTDIVNEPKQREFLANAIDDGVIEKEGERGDRRYWLNPNRVDHGSFQLIVKLVYPHRALTTRPIEKPIENHEYVSVTDLDNLRQEMSNALVQHIEIFKRQSQKIKDLTAQVKELSDKING
jgi:hypothetical protein